MTNTTSVNRLNDRERALEALRLRRDSALTWEEIATVCEYSSKQTAQRAVARLANRIESEDVEQYRTLFDSQLAWLYDQAQDRILGADKNSLGHAAMIQAAKAIIDRRAKLHGVDAVVKAEVTLVTASALDVEIRALVDKLKDNDGVDQAAEVSA